MKKWKEWKDLNCDEKRQVIATYTAIRAEEEEIKEEDVDISGVKYCNFIEEYEDGYLHVLI